MDKCKEIFSYKIDVNNMLFNRLGINYDKYELITEKTQEKKEFNDLWLYIQFFMKDIWENPKSVATILSKLDQKDLKDISHFIVHNLYDNIVSTKNNEHQLIYIISLLLKNEMDEMKDDINVFSFLDNTSCGIILEEFIYKKEVQSFFKVNLLNIIEKLEMETSSNPIIFNLEEIQNQLSKRNNNYFDNYLDNNEINMNNKINIFNNTYLVGLSEKDLKEKINISENKNMKEFLQKKALDCVNSPKLYSTDQLINNIYNYKESRKIFNYYINSFMETIDIINMFLDNLLKNSNSLPYSIRCICKIISLLIKKKYPKANKIEQNTFLAKFFFQKLVFSILKNPSLLLFINEFLVSDKTMEKIRRIKEVLEQFTLGQFFDDKDYLKPFNNYFIEKMPTLIDFFNNVCQIELPSFIDKLINDKLPENYQYNYFEENQNENVLYRNICFNFNELYILVTNSIKNIDFISLQIATLLKLDSNLKKIEQIKNNLETNKENISKNIKYFLITDFIYCKKYDKIFNEKKRKLYFSLDELKEIENYEQQIENNKIKIKNFFFALLYNYPKLSKNNISLGNISNIINLIKELKNNSYINSSINIEQQHIPLKWYIDSLIQYLPRIRDELSENDYEKLLDEIEDDLTNSLKEINFEELTEFIEYIKEMEKEKMYYEIIKKIILDIDLNKMSHIIIQKEQIPIEMFYNGKELNISPLDKNKKYSEKNKNNKIICINIKSFINNFPKITTNNNEQGLGIFEFIKYIKIPEKLEIYSNIIKDYLKAKKNIKDEKELNEICDIIYDYILEKLNNKLFPKGNNQKDNDIFNNCCKNIWIEFSNIQNSKKKYIFDTYLPDSINYFNKIIMEKSPRKKFIYIKKLYDCIYNLGIFNLDKVEGADEELPLLNYTFIKSKPKNIYSNCKYLELFLGNKESQIEGYYLTKILALCERMSQFSFKDILNMTESDYLLNCDLVEKGILY